MIDPASGQTPNLGANDGALIFPLSSMPFNDFRPTVQAAARAFLRTGLPAGAWDEMSLWLGLPASEHTTDSDAYMTDHLRGKDSWAYLRASRFKSICRTWINCISIYGGMDSTSRKMRERIFITASRRGTIRWSRRVYIIRSRLMAAIK